MIENAADIAVTVVLALADRATEIAVRLPAGATLGDALEASGLAERHPDVDMARARVGIFGKLSDRKAVLADGDRVDLGPFATSEPNCAVRRTALRWLACGELSDASGS